MSLPRVSRTVIQSVLAKETPEGAGALVRRSIGTQQLRNFTPFLMLDNFAVAEGAGFPDHPHRGMTTLTYMLEGEFEHEDFLGHKGKIGPGDLQFMIAGKGIMHAEMPIHGPGKKDPFGLQLWIDLPKQHKLVDPSYQELKASEIPSAHPTANTLVKVICGESDGSDQEGIVASPVRPLGGCWFSDWTISKPGEQSFQRIPQGWNAFIYTLSGTLKIGETTVPAFHTAVLSNDPNASGVLLESINDNGEPTRFVVVSGEPLDQEIVQHGPFVMDTQQGIREAFRDYQYGKNGFEGAHAWTSEIGGR
ncbi:pirin family protein [Sporobolomyces koalae]|uniref:pirin family protein n=1 Tax=Sporobolomyces koalae TaxID=500713 RepID=UPI00316B11B5